MATFRCHFLRSEPAIIWLLGSPAPSIGPPCTICMRRQIVSFVDEGRAERPASLVQAD